MKRLYIFTLAYYSIFRWCMPACFYLIFGYEDIMGTRPVTYLVKTFVYVVLPIVISIIIIALLPVGKGYIKPKSHISIWWFYFCVAITVVGKLQAGSFEDVLSGAFNGTWFGYFSVFSDISVLLLIFMFFARKGNIFILLFTYVLMSILFASRQGILTVVVYLLAMSVATERGRQYRKVLLPVVAVCCVLAIPLFSYTSRLRNAGFANKEQLIRSVVARCGDFEVASLALYSYDEGEYNKDVFERKYSLTNQAKLIIDSTIPGAIWEQDSGPNQYYRSAFMGLDEKTARENYNSINLTLPVYLTLKYPYPLALAISVAIIVGLFLICALNKNSIFLVACAHIILFDILMFFDWVYIYRHILSIMSTIFVFCIIRRLGKYTINLVRKRQGGPYETENSDVLCQPSKWRDSQDVCGIGSRIGQA